MSKKQLIIAEISATQPVNVSQPGDLKQLSTTVTLRFDSRGDYSDIDPSNFDDVVLNSVFRKLGVDTSNGNYTFDID